MSDTSRISMQSRSRLVRIRCRPSTSTCPTSDSRRPRLRLMLGWRTGQAQPHFVGLTAPDHNATL